MYYTPSCFTPSPLKYNVGSIFGKSSARNKPKRKYRYNFDSSESTRYQAKGIFSSIIKSPSSYSFPKLKNRFKHLGKATIHPGPG